MSPILYTCQTGAEFLGGKVKASTLKRLAVSGQIENTLIGGAIHFTEVQLIAAVDYCTRPAGTRSARRKPPVPTSPTPSPASPVFSGTGAADLVARPGRRYRSTQ